MVDDVADHLIELDSEDEGLERDLASPSPARVTEYAVARLTPDRTLRTIARICEGLHLSVRELTDGKVAFPTFH